MSLKTDVVKVLVAINHRKAEESLKTRLNNYAKEHESDAKIYPICGVVVAREGLLEYMSGGQPMPSVLVFAESLRGQDKENSFDFILRFRRTYPSVRIVFIAGKRLPGDSQLAALMANGIYDIIADEQVDLGSVVDCVVKPRTFADMHQYLPNMDSHMFDSGYSKNIDMYAATAEAAKQNEATHRAEREILNQKIQELTTTGEQTRRQKDALAATVTSLNEQIEALKAKAAADLSVEQQASLEKQRQAENDKSVLNGKLNATIVERDSLRQQLAVAKTDVGKLTEQAKAFENSLNEANAELQNRQDYYELAQTCRSLAQEVSDLRSQIDNLNARIDDSGSQVVDLEGQIRQLNVVIAERDNTIKQNKSVSEGNALDMRQQITDREAQIDALRTRVDALGDDVRRKDADIASCRQEIANRESDIVDLNGKIEGLKTQLSATQQTVQSKQMQIDKYQVLLDERTAQLNSDERQTAIAELDLKRQQLASEVERQKADLAAAISSQTAEIDAEIARKRMEAEALTKRCEALTKDASETTERINDVKRQLDEAVTAHADEVARMNEERAKMQEELDEANRRLAQAQTDTDAAVAAVLEEHKAELEAIKADIATQRKKQSALKLSVDDLSKKNESAQHDLDAINTSLENAIADQKKAAADLSAVQACNDRVVADMKRRAEAQIKAQRAESEKQIAEIKANFDAEKTRLIDDYRKKKEEVDAQKKASGILDGFRYSAEDYAVPNGKTALITMFYSPTAGAGCTSVALNTATFMAAKSGKKTLLLSLEWQKPTFQESLGLTFLRNEISSSIVQLADKDFSVLDRAVINKQCLMTSSDETQKFYSKYPDLLYFAIYGKHKTDSPIPTPDIIKGMIMYYAKKKNFDRIIVDVPCYASAEIVEAVRSVANRHIVVMAQDAVSMGRVSDFFAVSRQGADTKTVRTALSKEPLVICNRYCTGTFLNPRQITDYLGLSNSICTLGDKAKEFIAASNKFSPMVLVTQDAEYVTGIQTVNAYITGSQRLV